MVHNDSLAIELDSVAAIVVDPGQHSGSKTSEIAPRNLHQAAIPGARLALYRGEQRSRHDVRGTCRRGARARRNTPLAACP